jgi:hypothetical protein
MNEEEEYFPGKGCKCHAWAEYECCYGVDWTELEVYKLREELKLLNLAHDVTLVNQRQAILDLAKALEENEQLKDEVKKLKLALESL